MKLTKERVAILVLSVLLLLTLAAGLIAFLRISREHKSEKEVWEAEREMFEEATTGELTERDGVLQNPLIYLDDITVDAENEVIRFTLCNNTNHKITYSTEDLRIEMKTDGTWVSLYKLPYFSRLEWSPSLSAFSKLVIRYRCQEDEYDVPQEPGEYRIRVIYQEGKGYQSAVGYFSIP